MRKIVALSGLSYLLMASTIVYALPFNIVPKAGTTLPTVVYTGSTATAYYTVSNTTQSERDGNYLKYLPLNVTQVQAGGTYSDTCSANFNLAAAGQPGSSCTLQLTISGPVDSNDSDPHHHLLACYPGGLTCAGTNYPLQVSQQQAVISSIAIAPTSVILHPGRTQQFTATATYTNHTQVDVTSSVTWHLNNPAIATISTVGLAKSIAPGSTNVSATLGNLSSNAATLTNSSYAYIANLDTDSISSCAINSDGTFDICNTTYGFAGPTGVSVNPAGNLLYVANVGAAAVSYCNINDDGTLGACNTTGIGLPTPIKSVSFNAAGTIAYLSCNNDVYYCSVNSDGSFANCDATGGGFYVPFLIGINTANPFAYVPLYLSGSIDYCAINADGSLSNCAPTGSGLINPQSVVINAAGSLAYIIDVTLPNVQLCTIGSDGSFANCNPTGSGLSAAFGIALNYAGTYAYITNPGTVSVLYCPVNSDGSLGACNRTGAGFVGPMGIAIL